MVSSWTRFSDNQIPTLSKVSGGYVNSALAKSEAVQNGMDEAIFLDARGFVSEGSAENIFLVRNGEIHTPSVPSSILEGITRRSIFKIAADLGIKVVERDIARSELYISDEIFFSGTGVQVAWLKEVDRRKVGDGNMGPVTKKTRLLPSYVLFLKRKIKSQGFLFFTDRMEWGSGLLRKGLPAIYFV